MSSEMVERPFTNETIEEWNANFNERLATLTETELRYFRYMWPKYGTLYIEGPPGFWKTSIFDSIAKKMNMNFIDLRLTQLDETDIGLYPDVITVEYKQEDGEVKQVRVLDYIAPYWALEANLVPTLVLLDELNRAQLPQRNAALRILLERKIGRNIKFNDYVIMAAAGNLGTEDGTEVESFDNALYNRLIYCKHEPTSDEWYKSFAKDNINKYISDFVCKSGKGELVFRNFSDNNNNRFTTARSWTMFDKYLKTWYPENISINDIIKEAEANLSSYINPSTALDFITYLRGLSKVSLKEIREAYTTSKKLKKYISGLEMTVLISVLQDLKAYSNDDYNRLTKEEVNNIGQFLIDLWNRNDMQEQILSVYQHILDYNFEHLEDDSNAGLILKMNTSSYQDLLNRTSMDA